MFGDELFWKQMVSGKHTEEGFAFKIQKKNNHSFQLHNLSSLPFPSPFVFKAPFKVLIARK